MQNLKLMFKLCGNVSSGGGGGSANGSKTKILSGEQPLEKIVNASDNDISFSKTVYVHKNGYIPETGRKKDLEKLVDKYNINDVVVNVYRDKAGTNDLRRMKDIGFEVQAFSKGVLSAGSSAPPKDYYYMKRKKK